MRRRGGWPIALVLGLGVGLGTGLVGGVPRALAQTGAAAKWPLTPTDYSKHRSLEECMAALERSRARSRPGISTDEYQHPWRPLSPATRDMITRCLARYTPADSALRTYPLIQLLPLFLAAHRDSEVPVFVAQRLARRPAADTAALRAAIEHDTLPQAYGIAQRAELMHAYLKEQLRRAPSFAAKDGVYLLGLLPFVGALGDTALALSYMQQEVAAWQQLSPAEQAADLARSDGYGRSVTRRGIIRSLHRRDLYDSLTRSTASYVAALHAYNAEAGYVPRIDSGKKGVVVGQLAPTTLRLRADFWFRRGDSSTGAVLRRPVPGKVNLIWGSGSPPPASASSQIQRYRGVTCPVPTRERAEDILPCRDAVREVVRRFPEVEVTLVGMTSGVFGLAAYEDPAAEAEQLRRWLHEGLQWPGALGVVGNTRVRARAPDRRVVKSAPTIQPDSAAQPDSAWSGGDVEGGPLIIDRDGKVVPTGASMDPDFSHALGNGLTLAEILEATLRQPVRVAPAGRQP